MPDLISIQVAIMRDLALMDKLISDAAAMAKIANPPLCELLVRWSNLQTYQGEQIKIWQAEREASQAHYGVLKANRLWTAIVVGVVAGAVGSLIGCGSAYYYLTNHVGL